MRRRKYYKIRRRKKRGKGLPYIYKNKVYLGKRPQTGTGAGFSSHCKSIRKCWRR